MENSNETTTALSTCCPESGNEKWWIFLITSMVLYIIGFTLSSLTYLVSRVTRKSSERRKQRRSAVTLLHSTTETDFFQKFRAGIQQLISGDTIASKVLMTVTFFCNTIFLLIYIYRTYTPYPDDIDERGLCFANSKDGENTTTRASQVEKCFILGSSPEFIVEIVVVLELIFFAFIRFLAADNVVHYWLDIYTLVDVFTLPHIFVSFALGVDWVGLRSLRFIWFPQIVNVIRFLPFVRSQDAVDVTSLLIQFFSLWFSCTGIIHLAEAQGDFWKDFENGSSDAFLSYAYFIMVTFSTVGYGDISPATASGRAVMILFIIMGLAFFAAILPTIVDIASNIYTKRQFAKFDTTRVPQHVIVCGHITAFSAEEFLKDFLHPDRGDTQTHVLFLHPERPDPDLKNVIRSHYTRVQYLIGSVLNAKDLHRAKILQSKAVFIMANKSSNSPLEEDNANLLRLVSVKNTITDVPVIVQVLLGTSKMQVINIEGWKIGRDIALCLNELKLGLLAQSCICPGISTLVANLFYTSNFPVLNFFSEMDTWKEQYIRGASNEIYSSRFSHQFERKTFHEAAKICFDQLGLILISLEKIEGKVRTCHINPSPQSHPDLVIESGKGGMLGYFIGEDSDHVSVVATYCECCHRDDYMHVGTLVRRVATRRCYCPTDDELPSAALRLQMDELDKGEREEASHFTVKLTTLRSMSIGACLDEEYNTYVCEPQKLEEAIITDENDIFTNCLKPDIKDHVVLCVFADETSPLLGLHNFLLPLRSKYMPKDQLKPVVIVGNKRFIEREWPLIRKIPDVYVIAGSPLQWKNLEEAKINVCSICCILSMLSSTSAKHEVAINDKEAILCSLSLQKRLKATARCSVHILTDLKLESNVQFLDFDDEDEPDERIYKAQPFACGEAFSISIFDSVTSSVFHSPGTLHLIEDLIHISGTRTRSQVIPVPLTEYGGRTFSELYTDKLEQNAVCIGLFRQLPVMETSENLEDNHFSTTIDDDDYLDAVQQTKYYVITAPPKDLALETTDIAFLLVEQTTAIAI